MEKKTWRNETVTPCLGRWCLPPGLTTRAAGVAVVATKTATVATAVAGSGRRSTIAAAAVAAAGRRATEARTATIAAATTTTSSSKLSEIAGGTSSTASAATATATTTTTVGRLTSNGLEELRNLLVGLLEELDQVPHDAPIAAVEEGSRDTSVASTAGTTDTVYVVINVGRQVIVHNVRDIGDIETTGSDGSCNKDGATAVTEHVKSALTLTLGAVAVDRRGWEVLVDEEVGQRICHALGLDEDQSQARTMSVQDVKQDGALVDVLNVLNLLGDVLGGGSDTTNGEEDVVLEEVASKHLDIAGEGGREHESLAVLHAGHVLALHDTSNLRLETHIKHAVSLVKNEILDVLEGDSTTLYEVDQTSRSSHQEIASTLDLAKLRTDVSSAVDDTGSHPGTVGKLPRLVVDLRDQLTGRCENERSWVCLALTTKATLANGVGRWSGLVGLRKDREEETTSLARTSLSTSHQVTAAHDNGDGVLLHRGWVGVPGERDV